MINILDMTDPAQLHAAIDQGLHDDPFALMTADMAVDGIAQATRYAPRNKNLLWDEWVRICLADASRDDDGIHSLPLSDTAVIVQSTAYSYDEWHRTAYPLRAHGGPLNQTGVGACHRCDFAPIAGLVMVVQKPLTIFHIAAGRFVVEFAVCDECNHDLARRCGPIIHAVNHGSV